MCGICGRLNYDPAKGVDREPVVAMARRMRHRGPDGEGFYFGQGVALGHRRLSIIDLESGQQPMSDEEGRVWVVFNGEIYNFLDLRKELRAKGHRFATRSDTEVLVHLYEEEGEVFVQRLRGMFAIGLWDAGRSRLLLARDRLGIKPLYYHQGPRALSFASEIKALLVWKDIAAEVDPAALDSYLSYLYVPAPATIFKGIKKLEPGHVLVCEKGGRVRVNKFWELSFRPEEGLCEAAWVERLRHGLRETVRLHMLSDVPVGTLLSGGVDSTSILSLQHGLGVSPLRSFTVGYREEGLADERSYARLAADTYGSEHHEVVLSGADFTTSLTRCLWHLEEPLCELPAVGLHAVCQSASRHVKVLLSGEGGDEGFAGYPNYRNGLLLEWCRLVPGPLRRALFASMLVVVPERWRAAERLRRYAFLADMTLEERYHSRSTTPFGLFNRHKDDLYLPEVREAVRRGLGEMDPRNHFDRVAGQPLLNRMLFVDIKTWLPDDLLLKADKMSMAASVELRVPLLDHVFLELAASVPPAFKLRWLRGKYILRKTLAGMVPKEILSRPKAGFIMPYARWLKRSEGSVRDALTDSGSLARQYFRRPFIERLMHEHWDLGQDHSSDLFSLYALELWHGIFIKANLNANFASAFPEG
ncbi:MAG: asparagine synthase (glutamine-hydrolyzing) [Pseudomonadota bacterium]